MQDDWFTAARSGDNDTIRARLADGAAIDALNEDGATALMLAVDGRHIDTMEFLLRNYANTEVEGYRGWTAMTLAVAHASKWALHARGWTDRPCDARPMELLRQWGARFRLREAVALCDVGLARQICDDDHSVDVNSAAHYFPDDTYLILAARAGSVAMVDFLIERGAEVDKTDDYIYSTALRSAAYGGHLSVVSRLLDHGADVNHGWPIQTALSNAEANGHGNVAALLLSRGAKYRLVDAVDTDDVILAEELIRDGASPNDQHLEFETVAGSPGDLTCNLTRDVMRAVRRGNVEMVRLLLNHGGADYLKHCEDHSLLAEAASRGQVDIVRLLIEHKANVNTVGRDGLTVLQRALGGGHLAAAEELRRAGAAEDARNEGQT